LAAGVLADVNQTANSSSRDAKTRDFLVKVNRDVAPGKVGMPTAADQREGGRFLTDHPRQSINRQGAGLTRLSSEQRADPRRDDRLYIWINDTGGGKGLTAKARIANVLPRNKKMNVVVKDVILLPQGVIDRKRARALVISW
jgi:hypothetical protein